MQFLEAALVRLAKTAKRMPLANGNAPDEPTLSETDRADMQVFLESMLGMLPVLGVHAFEQAAPAATPASNEPIDVRAHSPDTVQNYISGLRAQLIKLDKPTLQESLARLENKLNILNSQ